MIDWQNLPIGNNRITCPECGRSPKDKTLGVTIRADGHGVAHCFRCGYAEHHSLGRTNTLHAGVNPVHPYQLLPKRQTLSPYWLGIWKAARHVYGTIVEEYLTLRGCSLPPAGSHVRYYPDLKHPEGWSGPAMLALITNAIDRHPMTLHRTWIEPGNSKAKSRLLIGGHTKKGGVIRLFPDETVTTGLAIAEGIETTLSLSIGYAPAWALVDAGNLSAFPVLPGIQSLVIGADHDALNPQSGQRAGFAAASACANRWRQAGRDVLVLTTAQEKSDFNDLARCS